MKPLVSIVSFAYNHEKYIRQALNGFVTQITDFEFEIIVHDDASTDNTQSIIKEYEKEFPNLLKPIYQKENQKSKGGGIVTKTAFGAVKGKYIALCEGDDYWIDPFKLQKQVDFLEANPDFPLCFHDALVLWEDKHQPPKFFCDKNQKEISTVEDVIARWFIPTASMVFVAEYIKELPLWFTKVHSGDWSLQLILATRGKIKYVDKVMSVYRKNMGGFSGGIGRDFEYVHRKKIFLLEEFNKYTKSEYSDKIFNRIKQTTRETKKARLKKKSKLIFFMRYPKKVLNALCKRISS